MDFAGNSSAELNCYADVKWYKEKGCITPMPMVGWKRNTKKKAGEAMVELDQFKSELNTFDEPLVEVRDSL